MSDWISVQDRLPELDQMWHNEAGGLEGYYSEVLIYDGQRVRTGSYDRLAKRKRGEWSIEGCTARFAVTHWQPLPDPPDAEATPTP